MWAATNRIPLLTRLTSSRGSGNVQVLCTVLKTKNLWNFLDFCEKCLWNLGGLIEWCDRLFGARKPEKWTALDAQILLHTQFFVELPLAAELQPVEVPTGRPNIEKIENRNSKVHRKCSVRTESAQIQRVFGPMRSDVWDCQIRMIGKLFPENNFRLRAVPAKKWVVDIT